MLTQQKIQLFTLFTDEMVFKCIPFIKCCPATWLWLDANMYTWAER